MTTAAPIKIGVVLGSTREQRLGDRVCRFVMDKAAEVQEAEFEVLDLRSYQLPLFYETIAPWNNNEREVAPNVASWLEDMASADGYLFVVPEYNYAVPGAVKNALDLLAHEADGKPASILSYSDTPHGGIIAGHELRLTLNKLGMLPLPKSVPLSNADELLNPDGSLAVESEFALKIAQFLPWSLRELVRYADALRPLRQEVVA